jgi:hypothetical protein
MEIALRKRNPNAVFAKQSPDFQHDLARNVPDPVLHVVDPEPKLQFQTVVAETHQQSPRFR